MPPKKANKGDYSSRSGIIADPEATTTTVIVAPTLAPTAVPPTTTPAQTARTTAFAKVQKQFSSAAAATPHVFRADPMRQMCQLFNDNIYRNVHSASKWLLSEKTLSRGNRKRAVDLQLPRENNSNPACLDVFLDLDLMSRPVGPSLSGLYDAAAELFRHHEAALANAFTTKMTMAAGVIANLSNSQQAGTDLNSISICPAPGCAEVFESIDGLRAHLDKFNYDYAADHDKQDPHAPFAAGGLRNPHNCCLTSAYVGIFTEREKSHSKNIGRLREHMAENVLNARLRPAPLAANTDAALGTGAAVAAAAAVAATVVPPDMAALIMAATGATSNGSSVINDRLVGILEQTFRADQPRIDIQSNRDRVNAAGLILPIEPYAAMRSLAHELGLRTQAMFNCGECIDECNESEDFTGFTPYHMSEPSATYVLRSTNTLELGGSTDGGSCAAKNNPMFPFLLRHERRAQAPDDPISLTCNGSGVHNFQDENGASFANTVLYSAAVKGPMVFVESVPDYGLSEIPAQLLPIFLMNPTAAHIADRVHANHGMYALAGFIARRSFRAMRRAPGDNAPPTSHAISFAPIAVKNPRGVTQFGSHWRMISNHLTTIMTDQELTNYLNDNCAIYDNEGHVRRDTHGRVRWDIFSSIYVEALTADGRAQITTPSGIRRMHNPFSEEADTGGNPKQLRFQEEDYVPYDAYSAAARRRGRVDDATYQLHRVHYVGAAPAAAQQHHHHHHHQQKPD